PVPPRAPLFPYTTLFRSLISGNPERRRQASEYLRLVQTGTPPDQIFARAFGTDPGALEHELRIYVQKRLFEYTRMPIRSEANLRSEEHTSELQSRGHLVC